MPVETDRVRATLYGQAIGDALGIPVEWKAKSQVDTIFPPGEPLAYLRTDRTVFGGREVFEVGSWSDDTDQALCILDAYLDEPSRPIGGLCSAFAKNLLDWKAKNPIGMGKLTRAVLSHPDFEHDYFQVAAEAWKARPAEAVSPNGAVMRTSVVGLLRPWDLAWTAEAAASLARVTHGGEECAASAVAVSIAIACLVTGQGSKEALQQARQYAGKVSLEVLPWLSFDFELWSLKLDEGLPPVPGVAPKVGDTRKCLGAAFWALGSATRQRALRTSGRERFRKALTDVIREGGDADTNGAVAGAMLGAKEGWEGLPEALRDDLRCREDLDRKIVLLLASHAR